MALMPILSPRTANIAVADRSCAFDENSLGDTTETKRAIRDNAPKEANSSFLRLSFLLRFLEKNFSLTPGSLAGSGDSHSIKWARQLACWLAYREIKLPAQTIGKWLGERSAFTIIRAVRHIDRLQENDSNLSRALQAYANILSRNSLSPQQGKTGPENCTNSVKPHSSGATPKRQKRKLNLSPKQRARMIELALKAGKIERLPMEATSISETDEEGLDYILPDSAHRAFFYPRGLEEIRHIRGII